jgi:hypothetical protein
MDDGREQPWWSAGGWVAAVELPGRRWFCDRACYGVETFRFVKGIDFANQEIKSALL